MTDRNDFQERIGVGRPSTAFQRVGGPGTKRRRPVVADDGPMRGRVSGSQTEHWSGRVDACVTPAAITVQTTTS